MGKTSESSYVFKPQSFHLQHLQMRYLLPKHPFPKLLALDIFRDKKIQSFGQVNCGATAH